MRGNGGDACGTRSQSNAFGAQSHKLPFGEQMVVVGSHPLLGKWEVGSSQGRMVWQQDHWVVRVQVRARCVLAALTVDSLTQWRSLASQWSTNSSSLGEESAQIIHSSYESYCGLSSSFQQCQLRIREYSQPHPSCISLISWTHPCKVERAHLSPTSVLRDSSGAQASLACTS